MTKRWLFCVVAILAPVLLCIWCLWFDKEQPRFSEAFDIGEGRILQVWSIRRDEWFESPNPLMVYYRIDRDGKELIHTTLLDYDDKGKYEFRVVLAEQGRLVCVYEVTRATKDHHFLLMYDRASGESWPRVRDGETTQMPSVVDKWRERFRRIKAEFPKIPSPEPFNE